MSLALSPPVGFEFKRLQKQLGAKLFEIVQLRLGAGRWVAGSAGQHRASVLSIRAGRSSRAGGKVWVGKRDLVREDGEVTVLIRYKSDGLNKQEEAM